MGPDAFLKQTFVEEFLKGKSMHCDIVPFSEWGFLFFPVPREIVTTGDLKDAVDERDFY